MRLVKDSSFIPSQEERDEEFLTLVKLEVESARKKFPDNQMKFAALVEEIGELAKSLLSENAERIYDEAIQVATMAQRLATEGDRTVDVYRKENNMDLTLIV